jgi:DNA-binding GntR family transcriptional regulator
MEIERTTFGRRDHSFVRRSGKAEEKAGRILFQHGDCRECPAYGFDRRREVSFTALHMSAADRDELQEIHRRSEACIPSEDFEEYDAINKEFHELLYRGSCNDYLETSVKDVRSRLRVYRRYPFQKPGRIRQSFADHGQIVKAISKGDSEAAGKAMRDHISIGGRVFADLVVEMARRT